MREETRIIFKKLPAKRLATNLRLKMFYLIVYIFKGEIEEGSLFNLKKCPVNKPLRTSAGMSLRKIRIVPSASGAAGVDDFSSADSAMAATPNRTAKTLSLQSIFCSNLVRPMTFAENKLLVFCIYFVFFFFFY